VTNPDVVFVLLAGIAFLGFVLDAFFDRLRITSMLPLMLIGIALVRFRAVSPHELGVLNEFIPYVSALTIAFILFSVGLEIRFGELARVFGRATAYTLSLQTATGIVLSLVAFELFHWNILLAFVFGFGLSGPSSVSVPALLRVVRVGKSLRTTLLFESVASDILQLLVPLTLIGLYQSGSLSIPTVAESLAWNVLGSAAAGVGAGILWLWILSELRVATAGYTWTLTITIVLATYGLADLIGFSPAIVIFVFGLVLGNALLLDAGQSERISWRTSGLRRLLSELRRWFRLSTGALDIDHIQQVHREVAFFASSFFFVYLGLLFQTSELTPFLLLVPLLLALLMLVIRVAFLPLLGAYLPSDPAVRRSERGIVAFNLSRGLAAAVIATVPIGLGIEIPNFLDAMFLAILFSAVVSTIGVFALYDPAARYRIQPPSPESPDAAPAEPLQDSPPIKPEGEPSRPALPRPQGAKLGPRDFERENRSTPDERIP